MPMSRYIDLNADVGESFGAYHIGADAEIMPYISSANVACGFHAGDPRVLQQTVRLAKVHGVAVGAHPGYPDLVGFGRRELHCTPAEVYADVLYQLGALQAFCRAQGLSLQHVKPHGALYNRACRQQELAAAVARAVADYDPRLVLYGLPGSALLAAGRQAGLPVAREVFADRAYNADGTLVPRQRPGAVITDPALAAAQTIELVLKGEADTVCVHGDHPAAAAILRRVRQSLAEHGIKVRGPVTG